MADPVDAPGPDTTPDDPAHVAPAGPSATTVAVLALPALGFALPLVGFLVSLVLVLWVVPPAGRRVWGPGRGRRRLVALLGFALMWSPALLAFPVGPLARLGAWLAGPDGNPLVGNTVWLLMPLCGPENPVVPTAVAVAVFVGGAVLSALVRRAWPWVLGALVSALSYDVVMRLLSIDFIC